MIGLTVSILEILTWFVLSVTSQDNRESPGPWWGNKMYQSSTFFQNRFKLYPNFRDKRTPDLIEMSGFPVETHEVMTDDGYILTLHRIPYDRPSKSRLRVPVFVMHGGMSSSAQWFWQPSRRALVFKLVAAGYDVWIGNARGTSYSQKHISLSPNDLRYWNFSQHEYGKYDVPAIINYITDHTAQPSLYWIGHSLGAGQFFIAMSLHPELNYKIRTMFALAPAVYQGNLTNLAFRAISSVNHRYRFVKLWNQIGKGRFIPEFILNLMKPLVDLCQIPWIDSWICANFVYLFSGISHQLNITALPGVIAHIPDSTSSKTESHFAQWIQSGEFREYDYGKWINMQRYGRPTPPKYNWANVNVPTVLYYSDSDDIVASQDVFKTAGALGSNVMELNKVEYPNFRHIDYVIGIDADRLIYNKIIRTMKSGIYDHV